MLYECFSYSCVFDKFYSQMIMMMITLMIILILLVMNVVILYICGISLFFLTYHIFVEIYLCIVWYNILVSTELWMPQEDMCWEDRYGCHVCEKVYSLKKALRVHRQKNHTDDVCYVVIVVWSVSYMNFSYIW